MKTDAADPIQPSTAQAPAAKAPPAAFGKGFVTDAWYFVALGRDDRELDGMGDV